MSFSVFKKGIFCNCVGIFCFSKKKYVQVRNYSLKISEIKPAAIRLLFSSQQKRDSFILAVFYMTKSFILRLQCHLEKG